MKRIERKNAKLCLQLLQYLAGIFTTKKAHLPFEDAALHHKGPLICTNKIKHLCHVAHLHKYPPLQFQEWDALHGFPSQISCLQLKSVQAPSITEEQRSHYTDILYHRNLSNSATLSSQSSSYSATFVWAIGIQPFMQLTAFILSNISLSKHSFFPCPTPFLTVLWESQHLPTNFTFNIRETPNPVSRNSHPGNAWPQTQSLDETSRSTAINWAHLHEKDPKGYTLHEGQILLAEAEKLPRQGQNCKIWPQNVISKISCQNK